MKSRAIVATLLVALAFGLPGLAKAAKPSKPSPAASSASIALNEADPHLGGYVTFATSYGNMKGEPRIQVRCYQNGSMGYAEAGGVSFAFLLGGSNSAWKTGGGAAQCTAELFELVWNGNSMQQYTALATTSFNAAG